MVEQRKDGWGRWYTDHIISIYRRGGMCARSAASYLRAEKIPEHVALRLIAGRVIS